MTKCLLCPNRIEQDDPVYKLHDDYACEKCYAKDSYFQTYYDKAYKEARLNEDYDSVFYTTFEGDGN